MGVTIHYQIHRTSRFVQNHFVIDETNSIPDKRKEKIIVNRLKLSGPISIVQYERLWGEKPYLTTNVGCYNISEVRCESKFKKFRYLNELKESTILFHKKSYTNNIFHQYIVINVILDIKEHLTFINNKDIYFDKQFHLVLPLYNDIAIDQDIIPDGVIKLHNIIYCIEVDMGTENDKQIRDKLFYYRKYIIETQTYKTLGVNKIRLYFCATENRISILKRKGLFRGLEDYLLFKYI